MGAIVCDFSGMAVTRNSLGLRSVNFGGCSSLFLAGTRFIPTFARALSSITVAAPLVVVFSVFVTIILGRGFGKEAFFEVTLFVPMVVSDNVTFRLLGGGCFLNLVTSNSHGDTLFNTSSVGSTVLTTNISRSAISFVRGAIRAVFRLI